MKNKKITSILIISSMTMLLFVGCSSKVATTTAQTTNQSQIGYKKFNSAAMKTLYSNDLKSLVKAKIITQVQSDKVLEAETKNMAQSGKRTNGNYKQNNNQGQSNSTGSGQNRSKNNRLSALVTSKVITQAQANTINQKLGQGMKNSQTNKSN